MVGMAGLAATKDDINSHANGLKNRIKVCFLKKQNL